MSLLTLVKKETVYNLISQINDLQITFLKFSYALLSA